MPLWIQGLAVAACCGASAVVAAEPRLDVHDRMIKVEVTHGAVDVPGKRQLLARQRIVARPGRSSQLRYGLDGDKGPQGTLSLVMNSIPGEDPSLRSIKMQVLLKIAGGTSVVDGPKLTLPIGEPALVRIGDWDAAALFIEVLIEPK